MSGSGDAPPEWTALQFVDRFGALAAFGRQPTPREMRRMMFVEKCSRAWHDRQAAKDQEGGWAKWASQNKSSSDVLNWLAKVSNGE